MILPAALRRIAIAPQSIGIAAVLVRAKDEPAKRLYLACAEFQAFREESGTRFLPIETVVAAFG